MSNERPDFRDRPLRDVVIRVSGAALLVLAVAIVVAWKLLPPPLPKVVLLGTGPVGGHYARFAEGLRGEVAKHRIGLELVATAGSRENIRLLLAGEIVVGLVQSGNLSDAEAAQLESVATVFYEPILIVERAEWGRDHIEGGRIAIGRPGSGSHALARELLADQGVREGVPAGTQFVEIGGERAVEALQSGEVDSGLFVTALDVPWVRTLFTDPDLRVIPFEKAEAFTRRYRYLRRIVIPAGLIDLEEEIPPHDVQVIATTASLVIRPDTHRALIPLLIESAREQLYQGDLLASPEEFPSAYGVEARLADEALQYFERGPSFLYRWLPFRYAFATTRLAVVLLPLLTLLYPLYSSMRPAYRWTVQRRVYRWYHVLRRLEGQMDASDEAATLQRIHEELERVGDEIRATQVPARYGASLFALRAHHRLLFDRLKSLEQSARGA
jgi:TRAP transporter TAXI family solute receptor